MQANRQKLSQVAVVLAAALLSPLCVAEEPASLGRRHPLLDQLNRETRSLYDDVRQSVVRAQVPPQQWIDSYVKRQNLLNKYQNLSPEVKKELQRRGVPEGEALAEATNLRQPATQPRSDAVNPGGTYIVVPPARTAGAGAQGDPVAGGRLGADFQQPLAAPAFAPNHVGVVLDDQGNVLLPTYIQRDAAAVPAEQLVHIAGPNGEVAAAKFVGSDRQTNLTIVKLEKAPGKPVRLGAEKPADGSLVMAISPADASGRLVVWNGGAQENGVVFTADGEMAGVARFGQFLTGASCRLIADQIIRHGSVKRATLGVIISEIREDDPLRQQVPVLGTRTAMRIDQVMPGSAADRAGLRPGDLLLALAGEAVSDIPSFAAALAAKSGQTELQLLRDGELLRITVELQPR
jgi:S1-C subfamily serine protease